MMVNQTFLQSGYAFPGLELVCKLICYATNEATEDLAVYGMILVLSVLQLTIFVSVSSVIFHQKMLWHVLTAIMTCSIPALEGCA